MPKLQFRANPKQRQALRLWMDKTTTEIGYGGAAGGGKSFVIVAATWMSCMAYPGTRWFWGRKELKNLKRTTLASYYKFCDVYGVGEGQRGNFNAQEWYIRFPNGSEILLLDMARNPSDPLYTRFGSLELTGGCIDESNEVEQECVDIIKTRLGRQHSAKYWLAPKLLETFNPDKGHVYRRYYKPWKEGQLPAWRAFVPALATDNPDLDPAYIEQLKRADAVTRARLLDGNFEYDATPGRLYSYDALTDLFTNPKNNGTKYISCDVAREGKDHTKIYVWDGWEVIDRVTIAKSTLDVVWDKIEELQGIHKVSASRTIVDEDGVGGWVVDRLQCKGFVNNSTPISHANVKFNPWLRRNYANLKAQCYFMLKDPIEKRLIRIPDCPDRDRIVEELDAMVQVDIDKEGSLRVISKADLKAKLGRSPDDADAIMMRVYFELFPEPKHEELAPERPENVVYGTIEDYLAREERKQQGDDANAIDDPYLDV